ncbi:hypothetical protein C5708_11675 [Caulobacter sp. CCUG 60055]|uniref:alpha/beta hydrolase family protein n=1 Tax=Caulobacter sp. CCUG 60055 TaxID=2100090 RepID=UPI001FA75F78|nr:hypothetical protein [Caulobacter sp. CCUG 60055]MCI3180919.1 hypothetical protein [Caulobacter sp. CCUG 60055]
MLGTPPLDWALTALLAATLAVVALRPGRWRAWAAGGLAAAGLALAASVLTLGPRWQMTPAYLAWLALAALLAGSRLRGPRDVLRRRGILRWVGGAGLASLLVLSTAASCLFPMFDLPAPDGPFGVGGTRLKLEDLKRPEVHTANPLDHRELMIQVWYPADAGATGPVQPVFQHVDRLRDEMNRHGWPLGWMVTHLGQIHTHTVAAAPLARGREAFPVIVFSHGLGSAGVQNTVLCEALASHGYVVVSIEHSYDGAATVFPDGRVAGFMGEAYDYPERPYPKDFEARAVAEMQSEDPKALDALGRALVRLQPEETASTRFWNDQWSQDQRFVIDEIERMQAGALPSPFAGRLDLSRLGVMGMSMGGQTAQVTCVGDPRCRAGVNLDGYRAVLSELPGQKAPFLYFNNGRLSVHRQFLARDHQRSYWVKVTDAEHYDFTDLPRLSPLLKTIGLSGAASPARMQAIVDGYVLAFFDRHLRGRPAPLLDQARPPWPDVKFAVGGMAESAPPSDLGKTP